ncbi:Ig-like domain-containing protein [Paenibacillus hodogayensis]|uniref:Ig-like domain-containing protein n=1 Tax=Paenibacillus hodogayensis TaxID=279208 RepID=A0ABV5W6I5_9BACL
MMRTYRRWAASLLVAALLFAQWAGLVPFIPIEVAQAYDPSGNVLAGDFDSAFTNGVNPFVANSNATGGVTQMVYTPGSGYAVEFRDTSAFGPGGAANSGSSFCAPIGAQSRLVKRINAVYDLPVGSDPAVFVYEFQTLRTAASSAPVPSGIQAVIEFVGHDNGVTVPRYPTGQPSIFRANAYFGQQPGNNTTFGTINDADVPALKFAIIPNGGAKHITSLRLCFAVRVEPEGTPEAFAVKNLAVYEVPYVSGPNSPIRGLVAHWNFEQVTDGKVADMSGNGHTATVTNAQLTPNGRVGSGLEFNGTNAYVNAGPASDYQLTDALSVAMWIRPDEQTVTGRHRFISWTDGFRITGNGFELGFESGGTRLMYTFKNETTHEAISSYFAQTTRWGKWMHLAATWELSSKTISLYTDGKLAGKATFNGPLPVPTSNVLIGRGEEAFFHKGTIDEIKLYNKALTEAEIQAIYNDLPPIPVSGIAASASRIELAVGSSSMLNYTIAPQNAKDLTVSWSNSNPGIVSIDEYGKVSGVREGSTVITLTTRDGAHTAQTEVQVVVRHPTGVTLNKPALSLAEWKTERLSATVLPADTTDKTVEWSSSDPSVAKVDEKGIVRGVRAGQAVVTVRTRDGGLTVAATVTVTKTAIASFALNKSAMTLAPGKAETLIPSVLPANATHKDRIRWSTSDASVAEIDQTGVVVAKSSGQAVVTARAEDGGLAASATVTVPAAGAGIWSRVFVLRDYMDLYDFPEELLSYPLVFPANTVKKNGLKLTADDGTPVEYELADAPENAQGYLSGATLRFRTALAKKGIRGFMLDYDPAYDASASTQRIALTDNHDGTATLAANGQQIKVPYGTVSYGAGADIGQAKAPIVAIARDGANWTGAGALTATTAIQVLSVTGRVVERGALSLKYEVSYLFTGGKSYKVALTVQHNEQHVTVDETIEGFTSNDKVYFKFSMMNGLDPDGRLVVSNGGYTPAYSGKFNDKLTATGKLPYELGLYWVNNYGVMRSTVFWKDDGANALMFSLYRNEDWKTARRYYYNSAGEHNLNFYSYGGDKYMITKLEGSERHWALGLIDRADVVVKGSTAAYKGQSWLANSSFNGYTYSSLWGAGPEVRLFQKLTEFSLNKMKDRVLDWEEQPNIRIDLPGNETTMSANETVTFKDWNDYNRKYKFDLYVERYLDGSYSQRNDRNALLQYANSRWSWTPAQRQQARALVAFNAYLSAGDINFPHKSMLAGHANFIIDGKQAVAITAGMFPEHPDAADWKREFMAFYQEWVSYFTRPSNPSTHASGGRWYENSSTYSLASLRPAMSAYEGMKQYDGTDLFDNPKFRDWMYWNIAMLVPTEGGIRQLPPQGAHATDKDLPGGEFDNLFPDLAKALQQSANPANVRLGDNLLWSITKGTQGVKPELGSMLFQDYGAIMRYDFGGPHEAYVNVQQLVGPGYRWHAAANGTVLYAAKGKRQSWNDSEASGDGLNVKLLPAFVPDGKSESLGEHALDGVLYDFDFAQYFRAEGRGAPYLARGVMMLRDDYIAIYDDMAGNASGSFYWNNSGYRYTGENPDIHAVKGGAGDQLHIVAPQPVTVTSAAYGAIVNGSEYVYAAGSDGAALDVIAGSAVFQGRTGYAGPQGIALFDGTKVGLSGFTLERSGGEFGISASAADPSAITGRIAGKSGGLVTITPPAGFSAEQAEVTVEGAVVPSVVTNGTITFQVAVSQSEGTKRYTIRPGTPPLWADGFESGNADRWTPTGGTWTVTSDVYGRVYRQSSPDGGSTVAGNTGWSDYSVRADVIPTGIASGSRIDLIGRYKDGNNFYYLQLSEPEGRLKLYKKAAGSIALLQSVLLAPQPDRCYMLQLTFAGTSLSGFVNGVRLIQTTDGSLAGGKIGLRTSSSADFDNVVVSE